MVETHIILQQSSSSVLLLHFTVNSNYFGCTLYVQCYVLLTDKNSRDEICCQSAKAKFTKQLIISSSLESLKYEKGGVFFFV